MLKSKKARTQIHKKRPNKRIKNRDISINIIIQGVKWSLIVPSSNDIFDMNDCDGFCKDITKKIYIRNLYKKSEWTKPEALIQMKHNIRHELIHAFIAECGLSANDSSDVAWPINEACVDFFAGENDKLQKIYAQAFKILPKIKP